MFTNEKSFLFKTKQELYETDVCLAELVVRLPKPHEDIRTPTPKTLPTFVSEGKLKSSTHYFLLILLLGLLTPTLFRDIATSLNGDEWRRLARRLGLTRIRIEAIEHDHQADAPYYMLLAWFKRVPRSTDKVAILVHGLMNINRWDLAQDIQTMKDEKRQELKASSRGKRRTMNLFEKFSLRCRSIESISYTI